MTIGLGTGSTSAFAIDALGKKVRQGLSVQAVASSIRSEELAKNAGIGLIPFSEVHGIDIYIDGADEIDRDLHLIKGGGGALLREKILAFHSKKFIVIAEASKQVDHLGAFPLPVEVVSFAIELTQQQLQKLGCSTMIRQDKDRRYISDNGNPIIDCHFGEISMPPDLHNRINSIPGVVENGLFLNHMVTAVVVGHQDHTITVLGNL